MMNCALVIEMRNLLAGHSSFKGTPWLMSNRIQSRRDSKKIRSRRAKADTPRTRHLFVDVTAEEKQLIEAYCNSKGLSASEFLAGVALEDALGAKRSSQKKQTHIL